MNDKELLTCPECGSTEIAITAEQMFMANTGNHYCHSVKVQDTGAKAVCLVCRWTGRRADLSCAELTGAARQGKEQWK